jgi:aldehyde dehydrogenase (NAD+)
MMETWHPLGVVGVISAFNFPVAVWSWNAALAFVCGDSVVWKPSEKTPLVALATQALFERAAAKFGPDAPAGLSTLLIGGREVGEALVDHPKVPLVSATGSTAMGRTVAPKLAARFARALLELGGNNAAIVAPSADLDLTLRGVAFAAMGTAGQRCTTLRRLFVHDSVYDAFVGRLKSAYPSVPVGDPRAAGVLVGPLIDKAAFDAMQSALAQARAAGGRVVGGDRVEVAGPDAFYVSPALVEIEEQADIVKSETFAPILYVMRYAELADAIAAQNDVAQGLSSSIFTLNVREAELFVSGEGSDCGIANVNIGPSGAEIGGAFGGEKETGGGREAGSDSWKTYMRRATNTVNYGTTLPLAQGVTFDDGAAVRLGFDTLVGVEAPALGVLGAGGRHPQNHVGHLVVIDAEALVGVVLQREILRPRRRRVDDLHVVNAVEPPVARTRPALLLGHQVVGSAEQHAHA